MTSDSLGDLLRLFEAAGIEVWLDGGWAVDALLGEQTRPDKDVDIIVRATDLSHLRRILGSRGFVVKEGGYTV
jgi:lincosamide nucleotidyltransferase A/C/D/E